MELLDVSAKQNMNMRIVERQGSSLTHVEASRPSRILCDLSVTTETTNL